MGMQAIYLRDEKEVVKREKLTIQPAIPQLDISWRKMLTGKEMMKEVKDTRPRHWFLTRNGHYHPWDEQGGHTQAGSDKWSVRWRKPVEVQTGVTFSDFYHPWNPEKIVLRVWEQGLSGCHRKSWNISTTTSETGKLMWGWFKDVWNSSTLNWVWKFKTQLWSSLIHLCGFSEQGWQVGSRAGLI